MKIWGLRFFFIATSVLSCYLVYKKPFPVLVGFVCALLLVGAEFCLHIHRVRSIAASLIGLLVGLFIASVFLYMLPTRFIDSLRIAILLGVSYFGMLSGYYISETGYLGNLMKSNGKVETGEKVLPEVVSTAKSQNVPTILDTSVIIDGRILDISKTGFIDGPLIIPKCVLNELQHIADSTEVLRRNKGRRGFDILRSLQNNPGIVVEIIDELLPHLPEVDAKLVHLAQEQNARIITNDLNLNKVAELQGVKVLNINELANAVRPVVIAGEVIQVHLLKEGKEPNQGVGYLDDGTMVIVEDGKPYIGQTLDVVVTQMLRTNAGQMIFTRRKVDEMDTTEPQNMRSYSGSW